MLRIVSVRLLVLVVAMLALGCACRAQISIRVGFAPPELPVYEQPPCPGDDYIWTPGYWAWDEATTTIECRGRGCWLRNRRISGHRRIGRGSMECICFMQDTGARR